ncbi:MAG: hypothetical protein WBN04_13510 [Paracoccaceae bacterium]
MGFFDFVGGLAGLFVILAFYARSPTRLRIFAILSNLLFILYAVAVGLWPVLVLHAVLLPLNLLRLRETGRAQGVHMWTESENV